MSQPTDPEARQRKRARITRQAVERARDDALKVGRSWSCSIGHHAPLGCLNDGSNCLCECHDGDPT